MPFSGAIRTCGVIGAVLVVAGWLAWLAASATTALAAAASGSLLLALALALALRGSADAAAATPPPCETAGDPGAERAAADAERRGAEQYESMLYAISHDLRSPLGAVLNYATILREDYAAQLDEEGLHMITRIHSSAVNAMDRVDGLLELSRIEQRELAPEELDMAALVAEAAETAVDPSLRFVVGPLPSARGDRELIRRVWHELLSNASRHSLGAEDAAVTVTGRLEGSNALYQVTDTGSGFDMRFADKLFRPLERLHPADDKAGVGIGLALVEAIVRCHGGSVSAEGAVGEGASFRFSLPCERAA